MHFVYLTQYRFVMLLATYLGIKTYIGPIEQNILLK